jgi:hypothetical protein
MVNNIMETKRGLLLLLASIGVLAVFALLDISPNGSNFLQLESGDNAILEAYVHFVARFGKAEVSKDSMMRRFSVFKDNFLRMKSHN